MTGLPLQKENEEVGFLSMDDKVDLNDNMDKIESKRCSKIQSRIFLFIPSKCMGLTLSLLYGLFVYFYITHLLLNGPPFTEGTNSQVNISEAYGNESLNNVNFGHLMTGQTSQYIGIGLGGATALTLSASSFLSLKVRCTMVLMIPSLMTKRGRGFMLTFLVSLIFTGPISTMDYNMREFLSSFSCMYIEIQELINLQFDGIHKQIHNILNIIKSIFEQYLEQLREKARRVLEDTKKEINKTKQDIENQVRNIKQIMNDADVVQAVKEVCNPVVDEITNIIDQSINIGTDIWHQSQNLGNDVVTHGGDFANGVLNSGQNVGKDIAREGKDAVDTIKGVFGIGRKKREAKCELPNFDINFKEVNLRELINYISEMIPNLKLFEIHLQRAIAQMDGISVSELRRRLSEGLKYASKMIMIIFSWWSKIFYLSIIFIIRDSFTYMKRYYSDNSFDNELIDANLRKKWQIEGNEELTPMRNWELRERYKMSNNVKLTLKERKKIFVESIPTLLILVFIAGIIFVDWLFSTTIKNFEINAKFGIFFPGIKEEIKFNSFIEATPTIFHIPAFNLTTERCLPRAKFTNMNILLPICSIICLCLLSCLLNVYASRLQRKICNLFFSERAKERADYLYNQIRKGRESRNLKLQMLLNEEYVKREQANEYACVPKAIREKVSCMVSKRFHP